MSINTPIRAHKRQRIRFPIRLTVVTIFLFATLVTATFAVGLQYYFSRATAIQTAITRFYDLADGSAQAINDVDNKAVETTKILAIYPGLVSGQWVNSRVRDLFSVIMAHNPMLYAIYFGFNNGDFYELVNLNCSPSVREQLKAGETDRWVVITIRGEGKARKRIFEFYSDTFQLRTRRVENSDYNAAIRPWFVQAEKDRVNKTEPYLFHNLQAPGQTFSMRIAGGVIAVDVALSSMSEYLSTRKKDEYGDIFLYRDSGELIASNLAENTTFDIPTSEPLPLSGEERATIESAGVLKVSNETDWAPIDFSISGKPQGYSVDYLRMLAQATGLTFEFVNGFSWSELVELYKTGEIDILQPIYDNQSGQLPGIFSEAFLQLPYSFVTKAGEDPLSSIQQMEGKTIAVPKGWSIIPVLKRELPSITVKEVESTLAVFKQVRAGLVDAGLDVGEILHYTGKKFFFTDLTYHDNIDFGSIDFPTQLHFLFSFDHAHLLPIVNRAINKITDQQKQVLADKWFYGNDKGMFTVPNKILIEVANSPDQQRKMVPYTINGKESFIFVTPISEDGNNKTYFGVVIPAHNVLRPALEKLHFSLKLTVVFLLLLTPAPWIFASPIVGPIKKISVENEKIRRRQYEHLLLPRSYIKEIDDLGISMNAMVAAIRQYEAKQTALMDSFIKLIAQAIDDKSHYTAGHCERVPELAFMLVKKAVESDSGAFADFSFHSEDEWREFRVAAWLHDCGKITTPEHIVDKGSKLETIYNRIHEVRTRFEVLWRDVEINYWKKVAENPNEKARHDSEKIKAQQQLQDDFAFVANMNLGGEYLSDDKKQRLKKIADIPWIRNFSDRLGLSPLEETRLSGAEPSLPHEERLLQDKPEHIIPREQNTSFTAELGITMEVPPNLYNQGEVYNLFIERGTLTNEDRFKINEHIISTIRMLDALPFPDELARVPRYASTHHETMDGKGYPRRLSAKDLTIPERIMVLADIFEALTAADRPYKKAKPVSVAIDILAKMTTEKHIDADVFNLFLSSGVYLEYAKRYLSPAQIDHVDVEQYLHPQSMIASC